jgi:predicted component of type VI protein secretion system
MAKLVIQNQGMTGRAHELNVDRTTIGRVEDNTFQIADPSVSSHHCEVHLRGGDIFIRDLNSTNGSYIGNDKITEQVLKPGQTLRLGQVELKLEAEGMAAFLPAAPGQAPAPAPAKKPVDATMVMPRGVSLDQLEQGGRPPGFDTNKAFSKKTNKVNKYFIIGGIVVALIIGALLYYAFTQASSHN